MTNIKKFDFFDVFVKFNKNIRRILWGVFDFLKKTNKNIENNESNVVDFNKWEMAHLKWREKLEKSIKGNSEEEIDPLIVSCDDKCELGKWIHGDGSRNFSNLDDFKELKKEHLSFHQCAGKIVEKCKSGDVLGGREY